MINHLCAATVIVAAHFFYFIDFDIYIKVYTITKGVDLYVDSKSV